MPSPQAKSQATRSSLGCRAGRPGKVSDIGGSAKGGSVSSASPSALSSKAKLTLASKSAACISRQPASKNFTKLTKSASARTLGQPCNVKGKCSLVSDSGTAKMAQGSPGFQQKSASYTPPPIQISPSQQKSASYTPEPSPPSEEPLATPRTPTPRITHKCHICGAKHLTVKSLEIHKKACSRRFEQREARRPPTQRRQLLEEHELPEGFDCVEAYYEAEAWKTISAPKATRNPIEEWLASWSCGLVDLGPEWVAHRPEPEELHTLKDDEAEPPEPEEEAKGIPCPEQCPAAGHASSPVVRQQRQKCPTCARSFRSEVFKSHLKMCGAPVQGPLKPRQPIKQLCSRTFRSQQACSTAQLPGGCVAGGHRGKREVSPQAQQSQALWSSAMLMCKGYIQPASFADESRLHAELLARIPQAEFVGAFEVLSGQHCIYEAVRQGMQQGDTQPVEERDLWHGTSWGIVPKILEQGFNRIFAGRHGTLLGIATYFSTDLAYACRFCDRRGGGKSGTKVAILARVIVGRYCKGYGTDVEPPLVDSASGMRYNSTVDNVECPKIFAVFRDFQAVPLFLVEFKS
mmetsp:Transcript_3156/g.5551  ORF Transcript_3156/g.5551 Transcript_3156/m.5551 type:complete len:575 (-) Transcript_3156:103-1827(-)